MAEFREVMTRFARLCDYYSQSSCHGCPVDEEGFNCACEKQGCSKSSAEELEAIIMKWAAEHPEPVYPSIAKYLERFGITIRRDGSLQADFFKANEPMSAYTANLLGISLEESENEKTD